jgi:hypothetical protein
VQSQELGPKLVAALWLNMGASAWSSADLSWTSAHQTSAARLRTAYRVYGDVSLGLEAGLNANRQGEDARAGLFGRYAWDGGKLSLAEICAVAPGSLRDRQLADPILRPSRRQCDTRRENPTLLSPRVRVP